MMRKFLFCHLSVFSRIFLEIDLWVRVMADSGYYYVLFISFCLSGVPSVSLSESWLCFWVKGCLICVNISLSCVLK